MILMDNKYYTPDISEFYVGFECERMIIHVDNLEDAIINRQLDKSKGIEKWFSICFDKDMLMSNYINDKGPFRVKCLDQSDIESFGFIINDNSEIGRLNGHALHGCSQLEQSNGHITIYRNSDCIFEGNLKNKSELSKVLKMLNVI